VAEVVLKPLVVDLATLSNGVTRDEIIGNYHWTANYTLASFSGSVTVSSCDYDLAIPSMQLRVDKCAMNSGCTLSLSTLERETAKYFKRRLSGFEYRQ
jgi:hypothetical protein